MFLSTRLLAHFSIFYDHFVMLAVCSVHAADSMVSRKTVMIGAVGMVDAILYQTVGGTTDTRHYFFGLNTDLNGYLGVIDLVSTAALRVYGRGCRSYRAVEYGFRTNDGFATKEVPITDRDVKCRDIGFCGITSERKLFESHEDIF